MLAVAGLSGCTHPAATSPTRVTASAPVTTSVAATAPVTTSVAASAPVTTAASQCVPVTMSPTASALAVGLRPLLLTLSDLPAGYSTSPSSIIGPIGDFNAAVTASVPVAAITFNDTGNPDSYDEPVNFGVGLSEALGEAVSAASATGISEKLATIDARCNPGPTVAIPGTVANVEARVFSGANSDQRYTYAIAYVTKGPYVVQLTWGAVQLLRAGTDFVLPPQAAMAPQVTSALDHLPS